MVHPNRPTNHHPITYPTPTRQNARSTWRRGVYPRPPRGFTKHSGGHGGTPEEKRGASKADRESWVEGSASRPPDPGNELSVNAPLISTLADGQNDGDRAGGSASRPPGPANDMKEGTSTIMHTTHNSSGGELPPCEQWCEPGGCEPSMQKTTPSNRKPGGCEPSMPEDISEER